MNDNKNSEDTRDHTLCMTSRLTIKESISLLDFLFKFSVVHRWNCRRKRMNAIKSQIMKTAEEVIK